MLNKPDILAGVSHEVRTQMNAIVAFSYLMNSNKLNESERHEFTEHVITSCEQLVGLFENFLDSAILETGYSREDIRECDAARELKDITMEFRAMVRKKGRNDIIFIEEDDLPDRLMLRMDVSRISRVLKNLFQFSLYNTYSGFIKLGCLYRDSNITFYIKDSGQGLPVSRELLLSDNPEIHYSDSQDTYSAMNLILARNLIKALGGKIRIEANESNGMSVFLTIPVKECAGIKLLAESDSRKRIAI